MVKEQIDRILRKTKKLRIKLEPTLSIEKILEFENSLHVKFPDTYVAFLTQIQNGGASDELNKKGPYYGIYPIEKSIHENKEWEINLSKEFKLKKDLDFGELYNEDPDYNKHVWRCENDAKYQAKIQKVLEKYQNTEILEGTLPICEYGCGDFFRLVVTGSNAGQIWVDSGIINETGFYSLHVDILTFYENWLDKKTHSEQLINAYFPFLEFGKNNRFKVVG